MIDGSASLHHAVHSAGEMRNRLRAVSDPLPTEPPGPSRRVDLPQLPEVL